MLKKCALVKKATEYDSLSSFLVILSKTIRKQLLAKILSKSKGVVTVFYLSEFVCLINYVAA